METTNGYKTNYEKKNQRMDIRIDTSMIQKLQEITRKTGISKSEVIREAIRRLFKDYDDNSDINLKID